MSYPMQVPRTYVNDSGNVAASGYYRSSKTQEIANMLPPWMHLRDNPLSIGQQFLSPSAMECKRLEGTLNTAMCSKFLTTAHLDATDVLYKIKIPSNINLTNASASGVRCIAAPDGCSPSGVSQIWVQEMSGLREFLHDVLPTRLEITSSGSFTSTVDGIGWILTPSGIIDKEEKHVDVWGKTHNISWCCSDGYYRKQDTETMEDYEVYPMAVTGQVLGVSFYRGALYSTRKDGSNYRLDITSTKTQLPRKAYLDELASFNLTGLLPLEPSGVIVDAAGALVVCDTEQTRVFNISPMYDYFILDADNRYIYFREDYSDSGVFISNT